MGNMRRGLARQGDAGEPEGQMVREGRGKTKEITWRQLSRYTAKCSGQRTWHRGPLHRHPGGRSAGTLPCASSRRPAGESCTSPAPPPLPGSCRDRQGDTNTHTHYRSGQATTHLVDFCLVSSFCWTLRLSSSWHHCFSLAWRLMSWKVS